MTKNIDIKDGTIKALDGGQQGHIRGPTRPTRTKTGLSYEEGGLDDKTEMALVV